MIDLHTHSTASDGSYAPEQLVERALEIGMSALALTDHDTLAGNARARLRSEGTGLFFIPGVEIEIESDSGEFHLLGLGLNGNCDKLDAALMKVRESRRERNAAMVERFQRAGIPVTMDELAGIAGGDIVSRAHFARLLMRKGIVSSMDHAFSRFIGKGKEFYSPRACLGLREAVSLIAAAGGFSAIAHPVSLELRGQRLRRFLIECRDQGVAAIEVWHPNHTVSQCGMLERAARSLGMPATGGSDYHGDHVPHRALGMSAGNREIPDLLLESLPLHRAAG